MYCVMAQPLDGVLHKGQLSIGSSQEEHVADREAALLADEDGRRAAAAVDRRIAEGVAKPSQPEHGLGLLEQQAAWHWKSSLVHEPARQSWTWKTLSPDNEIYLHYSMFEAYSHVLNCKCTLSHYCCVAAAEIFIREVVIHPVANQTIKSVLAGELNHTSGCHGPGKTEKTTNLDYGCFLIVHGVQSQIVVSTVVILPPNSLQSFHTDR
mmetsp:Transcript_47731/g.137904  ORF Transcript_47731/g.137904 Transcript_47731/m.137904 type:complete len:209 (+) Transcript_47731:862-1488(+)